MFSGSLERFKTMDGQSRSEVLAEALKRHDLYFRSVAPLAKDSVLFLLPEEQGVPVTTVDEAQRAVGLELYYACMYDLLKAQDHNLQIIRYQVSEIPELVRQLPERVDRLSAVFQGDWSPAKERWQKGVSSLSARQGESRYRLDDRLRIREDLRNRDAGAINRTLILIPDRTAPVDLSAIDPQKPPILG